MADQTNAEVSDKRLREIEPCPFCGGEAHVIRPASGASPYVCCRACYAGGSPLTSETAAIAAWNRRSVTSQASEGEPSLPRMDDIAAASIKYICADCAREESEYSCHSIEDVVIINDEVICLDHAKELHTDQQRRKAPDVAAKLRRQRMSIAAYQKAAENAPVSKRVERLEAALRELIDTLTPAEGVPIKDPLYGDMVRDLGKRIGFGALMAAASGEWRAVLAARGDPLGSEFVAGPCRAVLEHDLARARQALQAGRS